MAELKPCPFCGSTSLKIESKHNGELYYRGTHSASVRCNKCHARGGTASSKAGAKIYSADTEAREKAFNKKRRQFYYLLAIKKQII